MPDWGIIVLVIGISVLFIIVLYRPVMNRIKAAKYKKERTIDRKITVDKLSDNHTHLLLERSKSRPFYKKYFNKLPNEFEVPGLKTKVNFNLDLFESDYQNIIEMLVNESSEKYRELIRYLIDTDINLLITNIFAEITNHFVIPNFEKLNEQREIINEESDKYYAKWILAFRDQTINFICNVYLPVIYKEILKLIKDKDAEKYSIHIRTIVTTKFQEVIFNSLEKEFINLTSKMIDNSKNIGDDMTNDQVKSELKQVAHKFKVDFDKIYNHNIKLDKIENLLNNK